MVLIASRSARPTVPPPPPFVDPDEEERLRREHAAQMAAPSFRAADEHVGSGFKLLPRGASYAPQNPPTPSALPAQPYVSTDPITAPPPSVDYLNAPASAQAQSTGPMVPDDGVMAPYEGQSADEIALGMIEDTPVKNHNKGFWSNLGGAAKTALILAGGYARAHPATTWQELGGTIGAAGAGFVGRRD